MLKKLYIKPEIKILGKLAKVTNGSLSHHQDSDKSHTLSVHPGNP